MPSLQHLSPSSASFRLDWRPSAWLISGLPVLSALAALSVLLSGLPSALIWPSAILALAYGAVLSRREALKAPVALELDAQSVLLDDDPVEQFRVFWRGPLAFARFRDADGRLQRLVWWPDTLDPATRRELRLALPREPTARGRRSVAP